MIIIRNTYDKTANNLRKVFPKYMLKSMTISKTRVKYCISMAFCLSSHMHIIRNIMDRKKYEQTWIIVFLKNFSDSRKSFDLVS